MDFQAFLITFREALEALLIVGMITTYLRRVDQSHWNKWVWLGVFLALLASYGVALVFQVILTGYGAMVSQTYLKVGIMFASAALLTHMVVFMSKQSAELQNQMNAKLAHIITAGSILNMIVHSFLVVLREGVETVFFFAAISEGHIERAITSWGALVGLITASVVAYLFFNGTRRVPLKTFFRITGVLIMIIAAGLFVQGVGILQDLEILGSVYRTPGGEIGEVYNVTWLMPEHPQDEEHYIRDTGQVPLISGQVGIFLKAMLGYSQDPSVEEFVSYWGYYLAVILYMGYQRKKLLAKNLAEPALSSNKLVS
jgi:high-affinity iron transporter